MGYQPKSYRKFLATSVGAVMAASSILPVAASAASNGSTFPDVPSANADQVAWAVSQDIIQGYPDGTFQPAKTIDRAHAAVMIVKAMGLQPATVTADPFKDVKATDTYAGYIETAKEHGVFHGYADGNFGPTDTLSREQMATALVQAFNLNDNGANVKVNDLASASASHQPNIQTLADLGVTVLPGGNFNPHEGNSRLHLVSFLYQVNQYMNAAPAVTSVSANNLKEITVTLSGNVDKTAATDVGNYSLKDSNGNSIAIKSADIPSSATVSAVGTKVVLTLDGMSTISNQTAATLTVDKAVTGTELTKEFTFFDATIPVVQSVELVGPNKFKVNFSEPINHAGTVEVENGIYGVIQPTVDGSSSVTVELSASSLQEGDYSVKVSGFEDFAGFTALSKTFTLHYVKDTTAPTATVTKATQTQVVVKFDKPVTTVNGDPLDESYFYHTYTAYQPNSVTPSADNTTYTLDFTNNPLPEGTSYVHINAAAGNNSIVDEWGNKASDQTFPVAITSDKTAPEASVKVVDEKTVDFNFSEDVNSTDAQKSANYVFKDKDGKTVTPSKIVYTANADKGTYVAEATFADTLNGDYTVAVSGIHDKALVPNKLNDVTLSFNVADLTGPDLTSTKVIGVQGDATNPSYVYVYYPEAMNTTGNFSVLDKANYQFNDKNLTSDDTVSLFKDNKAVKITIADGTKSLTNLSIARVSDTSGNESPQLSVDKAIEADTSANITKVEQIDSKTVKITLDQPLKTVVADGFTVKKTSGSDAETLAAVSWDVNSDGNTVVTGTLKSGSQVSTSNSADKVYSVQVVANKLVSETGKYVNAQDSNTAGLTVTDKYAPFVADADNNDKLDIANDATTAVSDFNIDYSEALGTSSALWAGDLVITDKDGNQLKAGDDYNVTSNNSDKLTVALKGDYVDYSGDLKVSTVETPAYIRDAAGNLTGSFATTTVTLAPSISGVSVVGADGVTPVTTPEVGQVLSANINLPDGSTVGTYPANDNATYKWYYTGSTDTVLGTDSSFTVTSDNVGKSISVDVSMNGYDGTATWTSSAVVTAP